MADSTATTDVQTTPAQVESAPAAPSPAQTAVDTDGFDLDASDFADDSDDSLDDEGNVETPPNKSDEPVETPDGTPDEDDTDGTEGDEVKEEADPDTKPDKATERKDQLNSEIRDLVAQRNELRRTVEEENAKVYEARTVQQLQNEVNPDTGEQYTALEARIAEMQERQELRDYNDRVAEAQLVVTTETQRALQDFPVFDEKSPSFNKDIAAATDALLGQNLIRDPNTNQITGTHLSNYQLLKLVHDATQIGTTTGELKGQKAVKKMMASVDTTGSAGPKTPTKDPFLVGFGED